MSRSADPNPYESPKAELEGAPPPEAMGAWRQGDLLVVSRGFQLPLICVATNQPADGYDREALDGLDRPLPLPLARSYVEFASQQAAIAVRTIQLGFVLLILVGLYYFVQVGGGVRRLAMVPDWLPPVAALIGVFALFGGSVWGRAANQLLAVHHATDHHVWIDGAHPEYLARWPQWPYAPN